MRGHLCYLLFTSSGSINKLPQYTFDDKNVIFDMQRSASRLFPLCLNWHNRNKPAPDCLPLSIWPLSHTQRIASKQCQRHVPYVTKSQLERKNNCNWEIQLRRERNFGMVNMRSIKRKRKYWIFQTIVFIHESLLCFCSSWRAEGCLYPKTSGLLLIAIVGFRNEYIGR